MPKDIGGRGLDRRAPTDRRHIDKYGAARRGLALVDPIAAPSHVEHVLNLPRQYRDDYDQGVEGACVGFSQSWLMSILNRKLYDARQLYHAAQTIDEWEDTPPEEGTSLRAGFDVLRRIGHWRIFGGETRASERDEGITANVWLETAAEVRAAIADGKPVNLGIDWYRQFSTPLRLPRMDDPLSDHSAPAGERRVRFDYWIGHGQRYTWGQIDGGHAITAVAWSDLRHAVGLLNTWGLSYPFLVWLPSVSLDVLLQRGGEAAIVVDHVE